MSYGVRERGILFRNQNCAHALCNANSCNQVNEDTDSRRDVLALGELVNREVSMSNSITDRKCKGAMVRIANVKVMHLEVERQEDL